MRRSRKCPDCGAKIYYNLNLGVWAHRDFKCSYMENEKGERVWDNTKRRAYLKSIGREMLIPEQER